MSERKTTTCRDWEFECPACGHEWQMDDLYDIHTDSTVTCPGCEVDLNVDEREDVPWFTLGWTKPAEAEECLG